MGQLVEQNHLELLSMLEPVIAAAGSRIKGRTTPTRTGVARRSQAARATGRVILIVWQSHDKCLGA